MSRLVVYKKKAFRSLFVPLFHGSPAVSVSHLQKPLYMDPIYLSFSRSLPLENKKIKFQMSLYKVFYTVTPSSFVVLVANPIFVSLSSFVRSSVFRTSSHRSSFLTHSEIYYSLEFSHFRPRMGLQDARHGLCFSPQPFLKAVQPENLKHTIL